MNDNKWPAWFYGPNGQSDVFESADEVPEGWQDHPSKVADAVTIATDTDANGHLWNAEIYAEPPTKTAAGLWKLKPGMNRPEPVKALDL